MRSEPQEGNVWLLKKLEQTIQIQGVCMYNMNKKKEVVFFIFFPKTPSPPFIRPI